MYNNSFIYIILYTYNDNNNNLIKAKALGLSKEDAKIKLLSEKQPSLEFVTPEQLGDLSVFLCSDSGSQIRGQACAMDGGWTAQ